MRSFLVIVCSFIFAFVGQSCCSVEPDKTFVMELIQMSNQNIKIDPETFSMTLSGDTLSMFDSTFIDSNNLFAIRLVFTENVIRIVKSDLGNPFSQPTWACDQAPDMGQLNTDIDKVSISTNYDFDLLHEKGDDMEHYFILDSPDISDTVNQSYSDFVLHMNARFNNQAYYTSMPLYSPILFLRYTPTLSDTMSFTFNIQFVNGKELTTVSEDIIFKK